MLRDSLVPLALSVLLLTLAGCGDDGKPVKNGKPDGAGETKPLRVRSGGTMFAAIQEICSAYEKETSQKIDLKKGGSGPLFRNAVKNKDCDVYVCHAPFLVEAQKAKVIDTHYVVAGLRPVIVVKKGNPKGIKGVKDLARKDVRLGVTHQTRSTAGWVAPVYFKRAGISGEIAKKEIHRTEGSGAMARAVIAGKVDAGIIWNAAAHARRENLDIIDVEPRFRPDPKADAITTATHGRLDLSKLRVAVIVFKFAGDKKSSRRFAAFANSKRGRAVFGKRGFLPAPE